VVIRTALIAFLVGCGAAATPVCDLPKSPVHGAPMMWRVSKAGVPGTLILFGTIHTASTPDVAPPVWDALAHAQHYASELGDTEPDTDKFIDLARLEHGSLQQMLSADDWWALEDAMRGSMKSDELVHAKPWFAMIKLMAKVAPAPKPSMDEALTARAKAQKLSIVALESWDEQLSALDRAVAPKDLVDAIHARKTIACSQDQTQASYVAADEPALIVRLSVDSSHLISDRNVVWLPAIEKMMEQDGVTFVAVGVGHLLGGSGVPALLAKAGYTVAK
jgi:hypothetical protein